MTTGRINQVNTNQIAARSRAQHNGITCYPLDWKLFRALWNSVRFFLIWLNSRAKSQEEEQRVPYFRWWQLWLRLWHATFPHTYPQGIFLWGSCSRYLHSPRCSASTRDTLQTGDTRLIAISPIPQRKGKGGAKVITTTALVLQELY